MDRQAPGTTSLPERVLFASPDADPDRAQREAYAEAPADLRSEEVQLVHARDNERIVEFERLKPVGLPSAIDRSGFRASD